MLALAALTVLPERVDAKEAFRTDRHKQRIVRRGNQANRRNNQ
jgi:hypothetical protein